MTFQPIDRRIERSITDWAHVTGELSNATAQLIAMKWGFCKEAHNCQVEHGVFPSGSVLAKVATILSRFEVRRNRKATRSGSGPCEYRPEVQVPRGALSVFDAVR